MRKRPPQPGRSPPAKSCSKKPWHQSHLASPGSLALLAGPAPRLIDEWHLVPGIWDMVRRECDRRGMVGQFILTGSADPPTGVKQHSGVGRVARVQMRPLSLLESGLSTGTVSLRALFDGTECSAPASSWDLGDVADAICRGGWPLCHSMDTDDAQDFIGDYLRELAQSEVSAVDGVRRDPASVAPPAGLAGPQHLHRSRCEHPVVRHRRRTADRPRTTASYLAALERLFVVEDVPAWSPQLRSRSRLRGAPKRQLVDPSLAATALGADPGRLLADLETLGFLFESMCVRDLRVYCQMLRAELSHYRDNTGLEVDTIIRQRNGEWIAAEIKLGGRAAVEAAAASLVKLRDDRIDPTSVGEPRRLVVITATGFAYERTDGVAVVPITALGP